jgi:hypothetical protein
MFSLLPVFALLLYALAGFLLIAAASLWANLAEKDRVISVLRFRRAAKISAAAFGVLGLAILCATLAATIVQR